MKKPAPHAFTLVGALPWLVAASTLVLLVSSIWSERKESSSATCTDVAGKLRSARLELATSAAENEALRHELDRLVSRGGAPVTARGAPSPPATPAGAGPAEDAARLKAVAERARELLLAGNTTDATKALDELRKAGASGLRALEDLYASIDDPTARRFMLAPLLFAADREEGLRFLGSELDGEADPAMRDALLAVTSEFVTPKTASALEPSFLRAAEGGGSPAIQAAALRALRYSRGPRVEQALFAAASSPYENVRLAALEQIALRRGLRERLAELVARDPSARVRQIGECRLLIAESGS